MVDAGLDVSCGRCGAANWRIASMQVKALAVMALYLGPVPRLRHAQVQRSYLKGTLDDMSVRHEREVASGVRWATGIG
jgi:hypothetical protein